MRKKLHLLLLVSCLLVVWTASCAGPASEQDAGQAGAAASVVDGQPLFQQHCASCHSTQPEVVVVGPSLAGVASRASARVQGTSAHDYLMNSIMKPSEFIVNGYQDLMPVTLAAILSQSERQAIIEYLMTLE